MKTGHEDGTYICLLPSRKSIAKIEAFCKQMMLLAPVPADKLHVTVVHSKTPMPLTQDHKLKKIISAQAEDLDIWPDEEKKILVIKLDSSEI